jgi:hypothetical protein
MSLSSVHPPPSREAVGAASALLATAPVTSTPSPPPAQALPNFDSLRESPRRKSSAADAPNGLAMNGDSMPASLQATPNTTTVALALGLPLHLPPGQLIHLPASLAVDGSSTSPSPSPLPNESGDAAAAGVPADIAAAAAASSSSHTIALVGRTADPFAVVSVHSSTGRIEIAVLFRNS